MQLLPHKVVYSGSSQFGRYSIIDMRYNGRPARMLFGDGSSPQSGMALDDDPILLFDYNQRFLEIIKSQQPSNILIIGGGVFMLPKAVRRLFPDMTINVVEIDELLVQLARDYFELPEVPQLKVHIEEGVDFINKAQPSSYDMVIVDAFSGYVVPPGLIDSAAAQCYKRVLTAGGVVAINFISSYKSSRPNLAHELIGRFSDSFSNISLYQADADRPVGREQNMILAAGNVGHDFDYLQSEAI